MKRLNINLNGDSKEMLRAELRAAMSAVQLAQEKVNALTVHGRNYTRETRVNDWQEDLNDKRKFVVKLVEVQEWLEECALNVMEQ